MASLRRFQRHPSTRGEACHWILSRLRLPTARLSATHDNLRVATLLQIVFAAVTPVPLPLQAVPPIACAMKVSHWIFARLRLPTNPVRLLFPSKEGRLGCFGGFAAVGILTTLTIKRATDSAGGSFLGRRRSCRGPPSQLQVGAYTAHKSAFLLSIDAAHGAEDS